MRILLEEFETIGFDKKLDDLTINELQTLSENIINKIKKHEESQGEPPF
jgi:hypothetical protein